MNILNLHESSRVYAGAEVYIDQLQTLLNNDEFSSYWLGIARSGSSFLVTEFGNEDKRTLSSKQTIQYLKEFIQVNAIDIINIHSVFDKRIVTFCLDSKPVVKFSHSPVMVCPGRDKFWRYTERICNVKYGLHCFRHIYTEGCANRNPKSVLRAWRQVDFEIRTASKRYRKIVVMSDYMRNGLLECGVGINQILINPYFTEKVSFQPDNGAFGNKKRLLFIGRVISSKGPHILLKAVANLLKTRDDVYLDIVGDGLMNDELKQRVAEEGLQNKVKFHGWMGRAEIRKILSESYMFVFPSIYPEAFGIVGIEAMMHGKPVVAFDVGGVTTWLEHNKTGFVVDRMDIDLMTRDITRLLDDAGLYARMAMESHKAALRRFTSEAHIANLVELYRSCLS